MDRSRKPLSSESTELEEAVEGLIAAKLRHCGVDNLFSVDAGRSFDCPGVQISHAYGLFSGTADPGYAHARVWFQTKHNVANISYYPWDLTLLERRFGWAMPISSSLFRTAYRAEISAASRVYTHYRVKGHEDSIMRRGIDPLTHKDELWVVHLIYLVP